MTAKLYDLRLYENGWKRSETQTNLNPRDDKRLRELLEEQVKKKRGTLRLDLSEWRLDVFATGFSKHRVARVTVDSSGRTKVDR